MARTIAGKLELIRQLIAQIDLDLDGYTVLTELASNDFMLTPVIASMAGAKEIRVWGRDTRFGNAADLADQLAAICRQADIRPPAKVRLNERVSDDIAVADIVTNSGMLRPIDASFLSHLNPASAVVSLMYDAWEFRPGDIDINACRKAGIPVVGVNENDPLFPVFDFCGPLIAKMLFAAGCEVMGNRIVVWSGDDFGRTISAYLQKMDAADVVLTNDRSIAEKALASADTIVFADYCEELCLVGSEEAALFPLHQLLAINPHLSLVHLYGRINVDEVTNAGFAVYPKRDGSPSIMSHTLADLGSLPVLKLTTAGLRAAQEVLRNEEHRFAQSVGNGKAV